MYVRSLHPLPLSILLQAGCYMETLKDRISHLAIMNAVPLVKLLSVYSFHATIIIIINKNNYYNRIRKYYCSSFAQLVFVIWSIYSIEVRDQLYTIMIVNMDYVSL